MKFLDQWERLHWIRDQIAKGITLHQLEQELDAAGPQKFEPHGVAYWEQQINQARLNPPRENMPENIKPFIDFIKHSGIEWTVENINRVIKVLEPLLDEMEDDELANL